MKNLLIALSFISATYAAGEPCVIQAPFLAALDKVQTASGDSLIDLVITWGEEWVERGLWDEFIHYGNEALEICKKKDLEIEKAKICLNMSSAHFYKGDYQLCEQRALHAYQIYTAYYHPEGIVQSLYLLSAAAREQKKQDAAISFAKCALSYFENDQFVDSRLQARVLFNLSAALSDGEKPNYEDAENYLKCALVGFDEVEDQPYYTRTQIRLARLKLLQKNAEDALSILKSVVYRSDQKRIQMDYFHVLSQVLAVQKKMEEAKKASLKAKEMAERLGAKKDFDRIESFYKRHF